MASKKNMASKKRKYDDSYIKFGFTLIVVKNEERPQCVLCQKVLSNDSLKPCKLTEHLTNVHPDHRDKPKTFFETRLESLKKMKLGGSGSHFTPNTQLVRASYEVALVIAKQKKPHTIGETLVKPCAMKMAELVLGNGTEKKLAAVSLSDSTVKRRIEDMAADVKEQVIAEIKSSTTGLYCLQLDESTDVSSCSQLLCFVRYPQKSGFKEEFLFCSPLETTTKGSDVLEKVSAFLQAAGLTWQKCCGCCTDGAPSMMGCKSGFQASVKKLNPKIKSVHCMIHRQALASKTLPKPLGDVLNQIIQIVNCIKSSALNTRLFKQFCNEMDSAHQMLLFHTNVRWLSKGNVTDRLFELRKEVETFLTSIGKTEMAAFLRDGDWIIQLAYLADIFEQLNKLNLKLQGKGTTIIQFKDSLQAFVKKVANWKRKVNLGIIAMFERVTSVVEGGSSSAKLPSSIASTIVEHLTSLESEFERYFPELKKDEIGLLTNPFTMPVEDIADHLQDELIELQNDSGAKLKFEEQTMEEFWTSVSDQYHQVSEVAIRALMPFVSTYLCESGFSALIQLKTKQRNRMDVEDDLRLALSTTAPRIDELSKTVQGQVSH